MIENKNNQHEILSKTWTKYFIENNIKEEVLNAITTPYNTSFNLEKNPYLKEYSTIYKLPFWLTEYDIESYTVEHRDSILKWHDTIIKKIYEWMLLLNPELARIDVSKHPQSYLDVMWWATSRFPISEIQYFVSMLCYEGQRGGRVESMGQRVPGLIQLLKSYITEDVITSNIKILEDGLLHDWYFDDILNNEYYKQHWFSKFFSNNLHITFQFLKTAWESLYWHTWFVVSPEFFFKNLYPMLKTNEEPENASKTS